MPPPKKYEDKSAPKEGDKPISTIKDVELKNIYDELFDMRIKMSQISSKKKPIEADKQFVIAVNRRFGELKEKMDKIDMIGETGDDIAKIGNVRMHLESHFVPLMHKESTFMTFKAKEEAKEKEGAKDEAKERRELIDDDIRRIEETVKKFQETRKYQREFHGIRTHGTDKERQEIDVSQRVAEEETKLEGDGADKKKVEFYQIMEAAGGLDKKTAHDKTIEILTKPGKEQYATGNLNKPINPAIDPQSIKMQKFGEALNIARARPIAIKDAPHYEHPSHKLKMALKNFNTV